MTPVRQTKSEGNVNGCRSYSAPDPPGARRVVFSTRTRRRSRLADSPTEDIDLLHIFVDADACPVKDEIYRVAGRHGLEVTLVANSWMHTPDKRSVSIQVVDHGSDAADDWIVDHVQAHDIVVTSDIPLANRCIKGGASVLGPTGKLFTEDNIGHVLATRDLLTDLRGAGEITGGPPPLRQRDRSRFLQQLDVVIQNIRRRHAVDDPRTPPRER
ncbi:MAG: hypothetical protein CMJ83_15850 [Planctomycetes bacterium]|nr:hypothetical protein [Planctomycetota bacterium]